jgi:hypothetical protein
MTVAEISEISSSFSALVSGRKTVYPPIHRVSGRGKRGKRKKKKERREN